MGHLIRWDKISKFELNDSRLHRNSLEPLAQLVTRPHDCIVQSGGEQQTHNLRVAGSSPANYFNFCISFLSFSHWLLFWLPSASENEASDVPFKTLQRHVLPLLQQRIGKETQSIYSLPIQNRRTPVYAIVQT